MKRLRENGFVLLLVIIAIAVIGIAMFVLTNISSTMQFQSHTVYLQACERNLLASGLAWAKQNIQNESREIFDKVVELDVGKMDIRGSALDVTIGTAADSATEVEVNTSCSRGRQTLRGSGKYRIESYDKQETTLGARKSPAGY
jgi:preprotein translocase subunit SecF